MQGNGAIPWYSRLCLKVHSYPVRTAALLIMGQFLITSLSPVEGQEVILKQIIPPDNALVCPGEMLRYNCTTTGDGIAWQIDGGDLRIFNSGDQINSSIQGDLFTFTLTDILPGSPVTFISFATIPSVTSSEDGVIVYCTDGNKFMITHAQVQAPDSCQGYVTCELSSNPINGTLSDVVVTLNMATDAMCATHYLFTFGNDSEYVPVHSSLSATFTISGDEQGLTYVNQKIMTVDAENTTGNEACLYNITRPNSVAEVECQQNCELSTMMVTLTLEWKIPSFSEDNCLNTNEVAWLYIVVLTNATSNEPYVTNSPSLDVENLLPSSKYNVTITPVLRGLELSGDPLTTEIVLSAGCSSTPSEPAVPSTSGSPAPSEPGEKTGSSSVVISAVMYCVLFFVFVVIASV